MLRVLIFLFILMTPAMARSACSNAEGSGLSFGVYTGAALTPSTATITGNCTNGYAYSIGLNAGTASGATVTTRQMRYGAYRLNYAMYQSATRSTNWGNTKGTDARTGIGNGGASTLYIYATLKALQYPAPGVYADTIIATEQNSSGFTGTFPVSATVQATCSISATALDFGVYSGAQLNVNSTITVTCTNTTAYNIGLSVGNGPGASVTTRRMSGPGGAAQAYRLCRDSSHSQNWGLTIGTDTVAQTGTGSAQSITVYGQVAAGQSLNTPGSYTDTIVATLTY